MCAFVTPTPLCAKLGNALLDRCPHANRSFLAPLRVARSPLPVQFPNANSTTMMVAPSPSAPPLVVMVNGVPGQMASASARAAIQRGLPLAEEALTGPGMAESIEIQPGHSVSLIDPEHHVAALHRMRERHPGLIVVDYTHPSVANKNVQLYVQAGISFVIGTTGGDPQAMHDAVNSVDNVMSVIAPNMGKQIVAFQAMMEMMAEKFPGAFAGYKLSVKESHQKTKADTSGTAKSVVASFNKLGLDFPVENIDRLRDRERSMNELHVPEAHLESGHAFHTYHITSEDGSVNFEFQHNVCGRTSYAEGTIDAVKFLHSRLHSPTPSDKRIFTMIDILQSGAMS